MPVASPDLMISAYNCALHDPAPDYPKHTHTHTHTHTHAHTNTQNTDMNTYLQRSLSDNIPVLFEGQDESKGMVDVKKKERWEGGENKERRQERGREKERERRAERGRERER